MREEWLDCGVLFFQQYFNTIIFFATPNEPGII